MTTHTAPISASTSRWMTAARYATAYTLWLLAGMILFKLTIGPVVLTLTETHGVHAGDAFALIPVWLAYHLLPGD